MTATDPEDPRPHLAIVLDTDNLDAALRLAKLVQPYFAIAKVGLELYSATGPRSVAALIDTGFDVFVDLKLHDIPNTVERAARVVGALGARMLTIHTQGGEAMVRAACEGLAAGAASAGAAPPIGLGVTVLTSDSAASEATLLPRARLAAAAGCGGVVCAASDLSAVRDAAPGLLTVVPGIRMAGGERHDQARVATPYEAIVAGADVLVVGRAVTGADDPAAAACEVFDLVHAALGR